MFSSKSILATAFFVASALAIPFGTCSTEKALLELPAADSTLAKQSAAPSFALLGVGVQNYTCSAEGKYVLSGAVAELFDISCLAGKPAFKTIQDTALTIFKLIPDKFINNQNRGRLTGPLSLLSSGKHYFTPKGASNPPVWDMRSTGPRAVLGKAGAYVVGSKKAGIPAPTGAKDIDWLEVNGVEGQLATTIYRTDTRGGQPPASCKAGSAQITVKYTSKYFLFGSSVA